MIIKPTDRINLQLFVIGILSSCEIEGVDDLDNLSDEIHIAIEEVIEDYAEEIHIDDYMSNY